jgi:hypothetical protein
MKQSALVAYTIFNHLLILSKTFHAAQSGGMQLGAYHIPVRAHAIHLIVIKLVLTMCVIMAASVINQDWDQFL